MKARKMLSVILSSLFTLFTFAGCNAPSAHPDMSEKQTSPASAQSSPSADAAKIGVIFYSKDDALGSAMYATLNYAAEILDVELVWKIGDLDPNAQITAAENMISAGCDGILCMPMSEVVTQKVSKLCNDNQVYYANCFRTIVDPSIKSEVDSYEYFVGCCSEDEVAAAEQVVKIMSDAGRKKCGVNYVPVGSALALRNTGFNNGFENSGIQKLAEYTSPEQPDINAVTSVVQNYINTYSDLDVIFSGSAGMGQGEAMVNTIESLAPGGKVQLATFDVFSGMEEAFANKTLGCAVGGMSPDALFSFMMLYNKVAGTPLSDKPEYLTQNYIFVTDTAGAEAYEKYIDNPDYMIYTEKEIKSMSKVHNPDFTIDDLRAIMSEYTLENIMEKVS